MSDHNLNGGYGHQPIPTPPPPPPQPTTPAKQARDHGWPDTPPAAHNAFGR